MGKKRITIKNERVGQYDDELRYKNYKVRRYDYADVPVLELSNLEGTWMVRVPYDSETYQMACMLIDAKEDNELIDVFFTNLQSVSGIPNGYYQQGILLLTMCYVNPALLSGSVFPDKEQRQFRKDVKMLRKMFLEWADESRKLRDGRDDPGELEDYYLHKSEDVLGTCDEKDLDKIRD